jgi:hypothetical protein
MKKYYVCDRPNC